MIRDIEDFGALEAFFRIIEQGLQGLADGDHFFELLADDVVFDFIITVPDYPRRVVGRQNLIELYRGYGSTSSSTAATTCEYTGRIRLSSVVLDTGPRAKPSPGATRTATDTSL